MFVCFSNCAWYQINEVPDGTKYFLLKRNKNGKKTYVNFKGMHCLYLLRRGCKTFKGVSVIPCVFDSSCFFEEIAVSYQKYFAEQDMGLWSILSTANVVKTFKQSFVGQVTPLDSNCIHALFPRCSMELVYEQTTCVWECSKKVTYILSGVSLAEVWCKASEFPFWWTVLKWIICLALLRCIA